ncbi:MULTISPECIES: helix-turn-helix domain-containing protein [Coprobacillaceae]|uniref:MerR family transcriptional regulator n=1 Tax=Coprobacillaceae TaxID=2810280 RepID=UPI000E467D4A|nr:MULTISPECIES: helix-turn-helix domain-containing protein [Coprobacillaceae]RHM62916.1 MerR family transcriptional regulator [Coprobacillus sp. AF33-1AC]RHS94943.1 MerR family transcriptional regulator [Erysipelatoclostridium sp. AM42-17]
MKNNYLSIGEMAKMNHTTISTLRLYDEMDLLKPAYVNEATNYRYYDIKQNARLDLIQYMKELQMNLKEIKELLDKEDVNLIEAILIKKKQQLVEEIDKLEMTKDAITRTIYSLERFRKSPRSGTMTLEYIDRRRIYSMNTDLNFYEYDIDVYESILNQLKNDLVKHHYPQIYYCNAGTFLKKEDFIHQNFVSHEIFVFVDDHFPKKEDIKIIENGMYACIYLDDFHKEVDYAKKLLHYCQENNFNICGDYICEVLSELSIFDHNERSMFLRLQVPVSFNK